MKKHIAEFKTVLLALHGTSCELRRLKHDQLSVAFFAVDTPILRSYTAPLQNLKTLHLNFEAIVTPRMIFWQRLGEFLQALHALKDLKFGFAPFDNEAGNNGTWCDGTDPRTWYVPLWKMLGDHTWKGLERLSLEGLVLCENGLFNLLKRHSQTLR